MTSSTDNRKSRYVQGGITDKYSKKLGWWERYEFSQSEDDITVIIDAKYDQRPHLVAYDFLGSDKLMWLILQYNNILDISTEFVAGKEIKIPSRSRTSIDILTKQTGGNTDI